MQYIATDCSFYQTPTPTAAARNESKSGLIISIEKKKKKMPVVGMAEVDIEYKGQKQCMSLLVVPGNGPSLLGRNWLRHIQLDWREVNRISTSGNSVEAARSVLQKYPDLLSDDIGTMNGVKGHLQVNSDAEPRFCKARNVPYALRDKVEEELSRLERDGIIEPVEL